MDSAVYYLSVGERGITDDTDANMRHFIETKCRVGEQRMAKQLC